MIYDVEIEEARVSKAVVDFAGRAMVGVITPA